MKTQSKIFTFNPNPNTTSVYLEYELYNVYSYAYIYELQLVFQLLQKEILRRTPCSNNHKLIILIYIQDGDFQDNSLSCQDLSDDDNNTGEDDNKDQSKNENDNTEIKNQARLVSQ